MGWHEFFWFGLVGWVAGWVTGKNMRSESHSPWVDAFMGMIGGTASGYPVREWEVVNNWGFLMAVLVATTGAALLTWVTHRVKDAVQHRQTAH
jgi:uncharacterized membrane protein YeaQ/YmgE (transglycosylase-associated protein family)